MSAARAPQDLLHLASKRPDLFENSDIDPLSLDFRVQLAKARRFIQQAPALARMGKRPVDVGHVAMAVAAVDQRLRILRLVK